MTNPSTLERLRLNSHNLTHQVSKGVVDKVPELLPVINHIGSNADLEGPHNPETYILRTGINLLRVIRQISNISEEDIRLLAAAEQNKKELGMGHNSASHITPSQFLTQLGSEKRTSLYGIFLKGLTEGTEINKVATQDLSQRLIDGHKWRERNPNKKPLDSDPTTHTIIFGHTDPNWIAKEHPEEFIVFTMTHYLDRIFQAAFKDDPDEKIRALANTKDIFVDAITAMVRLKKAQGITIGNLADMYNLPRNEGGVGWNNPNRQAAYDLAVNPK